MKHPAIEILLFLVMAILSVFNCLAGIADLDPTFGNGGKVVTQMGPNPAEIRKVLVQPDGKVVTVGYGQESGNSFQQFTLARYLWNGTLDTTFGTGGRVFTTVGLGHGQAYDAAIQTDGKIVVVGKLQTSDRVKSVVVRYNQSGSLDSGFASGGMLVANSQDNSADYARSVVIQPDGRVVVGNYAVLTINNTPILGFSLFRLNTNGAFDTNFNGTGKTVGEMGNFSTGEIKIATQPDGKILVAGPGGTGTNIDFAVVRYTAAGAFDGTFGNQGRTYTNISGNDIARDLAVFPDGKFVVVGQSRNDDPQVTMVGYTANGAINTTFGFFGVVNRNIGQYSDMADSVAIQRDGRIVLSGTTSRNVAVDDVFVLRTRANGSTDHVFGDAGLSVYPLSNGDDTAYSVAVQPNGRILTAGSTLNESTSAFSVIRLLGRGTVGDYDTDGKADIGVYRPAEGTWYIARSANPALEIPFGNGADIPLTADFDGDGISDISVYRPSTGTWYILRSQEGFISYRFGMNGDIPVPADRDGDGKADISVFRPSDGVWHFLRSGANNFYEAHQFGMNGDVPMSGDYDGDGRADLAVFRPSDGVWYVLGTGRGFFAGQFGLMGDIPVSGDFDGDTVNDLAVFRPANGTWYLLRSTDGQFNVAQFGLQGDRPQASDFDGDGRADLGIYRPSTSVWYVLRSSDGSAAIVQWGLGGDQPLASPLAN